LEKLKFFKKKDKELKKNTNFKDKQSYTQVSALKIEEILKLKANFSNLSAKKIKNIHNMINSSGKMKPSITNKILTGCDTGAE